MESYWAAAYLTHPIAIAMALGFVGIVTFAVSSKSAKPPALSRRQLLLGYVGIFLGCVLVSAWDSYVSPDEALAVWKVPPENYWGALGRAFSVQLVLLSYASLIGAAVIGIPIVMALSRRRLATVPAVLIASVIISLAVAGAFIILDAPSPNARLVDLAPPMVFYHLVLSLAFCLGAGLQWHIRQRP